MPLLKKRKSDGSTVVGDEAPSKRPRSLSSKDVASAVTESRQVDAKRGAVAPNCSADDMSAADAISNSIPSSHWSSEATYCKHSAKGKVIQHFKEVLSSRGDRTHAFGACVSSARIKLMLSSHSGIIESDEIDFVDKQELLAIFLLMFATSAMFDLRFNAKTGYCNPLQMR